LFNFFPNKVTHSNCYSTLSWLWSQTILVSW
jgi:hypothetical protein